MCLITLSRVGKYFAEDLDTGVPSLKVIVSLL